MYYVYKWLVNFFSVAIYFGVSFSLFHSFSINDLFFCIARFAYSIQKPTILWYQF